MKGRAGNSGSPGAGERIRCVEARERGAARDERHENAGETRCSRKSRGMRVRMEEIFLIHVRCEPGGDAFGIRSLFPDRDGMAPVLLHGDGVTLNFQA